MTEPISPDVVEVVEDAEIALGGPEPSQVLDILFQIQQSLKAPKDQRNTFGKYNYRNIETILEEVKKLASPYHSAIVCTDRVEVIGGWHYVRSTVTLMTPHGSVSASASAREAESKKGMDAGQITGACSSYARKYAAQGLFAISGAADDDLDSLPPEREPDHYPEGQFEAKCRRCGRIGNNLNARTAQTFPCPSCGAVDWQVTRVYQPNETPNNGRG